MRILLAVDGSPCSNAAVDEVCRRPWPPESIVRLISVRSPVELNHLPEASHQPMAYDDIFKKPGWERARVLDDAVALLKQHAPNLQVIPALLEGRPKDVILDEAEQWSADLIVLGSNGYGTIKRLFLGSVSLAVALNATCSVEIVRRPPNLPAETAPVVS